MTKRLINIHLQFIHVVDNFAKSFRRNKNFQNYRTDGKEQSKDFTGEKVNLKHLSILTPVGTWVCFLTSISPHMPQIKNHHVPAPSGERVKAVSSPGRKNTQMGDDLRHSISTPPIRSRGYKSETGKLCSGTETSTELNQGYSPCGTWGSQQLVLPFQDCKTGEHLQLKGFGKRLQKKFFQRRYLPAWNKRLRLLRNQVGSHKPESCGLQWLENYCGQNQSILAWPVDNQKLLKEGLFLSDLAHLRCPVMLPQG